MEVRFSDAPPGGAGACPLSRDAPSVHNLNPPPPEHIESGECHYFRVTVGVARHWRQSGTGARVFDPRLRRMARARGARSRPTQEPLRSSP